MSTTTNKKTRKPAASKTDPNAAKKSGTTTQGRVSNRKSTATASDPEPAPASRKATTKTTEPRKSPSNRAKTASRPKASTEKAPSRTTKKSTTPTATTAKRTRARKSSDPVAQAAATAAAKAAGTPKKLTEENAGDAIVVVDRRTSSERRKTKTTDKQLSNAEKPKIERREKVNRRRQIDPTTCERDYSTDEIEFMNALEAYKRENGRPFPTCSEILEVIRGLGYSKPVAGELIDPKDETDNPFAELPGDKFQTHLEKSGTSLQDRFGGLGVSTTPPVPTSAQ